MSDDETTELADLFQAALTDTEVNEHIRMREAAAQRCGWDQAIAALRDRGAGTAVGRLLARTNGDVNGIQIAAALADYLAAVRDTPAEGGIE